MFWILIIVGLILYFVLRGKGDRAQVAGAPKRAMGQGPVEAVKFVCPYPKCASCGAPADGMKQEWDGMRAVKWTCGSCGTVAGVQELRDEELPASARRRLGLDQPAVMPQGSAPSQPYQGSGVGGLLTGLMIGSMMSGGEHRHRDSADWDPGSSSDASWSEGGNETWGDDGGSSDSGGDWGDSGGGDSGGDW